MTAIPEPSKSTALAIHLLHAVKAASEEDRPYLGWSELGAPCDRALWYRFRWAEREVLDGRVARLFDSGHREEARVLEELRAMGCKVWDRDPQTGEQFSVSSVGGHLKGHADAVVQGLPEAPRTPQLVDVKTIKSKKFDELLKKGLASTFPKYLVQGTGYLGHLKLDRAAFIFVCKDDDRIHIERFEFDRELFEQSERRAERIIKAAEPPVRISDDPEWFECRFCAFKDQCHGTAAPLVSCRTCAHATPLMTGDGWWRCEKHDGEIGIRNQRQGCGDHRVIPILLERFAKPVDSDGDSVRYELVGDGRTFVNGPKPGFSSQEIRAAGDKRALVSPEIAELREQFPNSRIAA